MKMASNMGDLVFFKQYQDFHTLFLHDPRHCLQSTAVYLKFDYILMVALLDIITIFFNLFLF